MNCDMVPVMDPKQFVLTYFGVVINGNVQTPPLKPPYNPPTFIDDVADLTGASTNQINPSYFPTDECAADLASMLAEFAPAIVPGPYAPVGWDGDPDAITVQTQHMLTGDAATGDPSKTLLTAPWLRFHGFNGLNAPVTFYAHAGMLVEFFNHGLYPPSALAQVRQQILSQMKDAPASV